MSFENKCQLALIVAQSFNKTVTRIFSEETRNYNRQQKSQLSISPTNHDLPFSTIPENLFGALRDSICHNEQPSHEARVLLSGFEVPQFDLIFSLCGIDLWHPLHVGHETTKNMALHNCGISDLCAELKRSKSHKRQESQLLLCERTLRKLNQPQHRAKVSRSALQPSKITLSQVLKDEEVSRGEGLRQYRTLKRKEKMGLGLKIAASLAYLYGSPFVQGLWTSDTIYIQKGDGLNSLSGKTRDPEAYVSVS